jgi:hypothetical protein
MERQLDDPADQIKRPQHCMNDLVTVLALPSRTVLDCSANAEYLHLRDGMNLS